MTSRHLQLLAAVALAMAAALVGHAADPPRPSFLCLVAEDLPPMLGCQGDPLARTPVLDRLAREGVRFDRCFTLPVCAPSRFTLITGTPAVSSGPAHHMRASGKLPPGLRGFPAYLRDAGYYAVNRAKTDYNAPMDLKDIWDASGTTAHWRQRKRPDQPFLAVFNFEATHESCLFPLTNAPAGPPTDPAKVRVPPYQPDTPEIRADWARQYDRLARLDAEAGRVLEALDADGLGEDTIVLFYGDNGGVTPRSKRFLHRSGTQVPLILKFPAKWRHLAPAGPGGVVRTPVCFEDFGPTLLALAGVPAPGHFTGRPFAGPDPGARDLVFLSRDRMDERYDMSRAVTDGRWLYLRHFRPDVPYVEPLDYMFRARGYQSWAREAATGGLTAATARFWGRKPAEELYDLELDPDNVSNLAADPAHAATRDRLRGGLRRLMLEHHDNGLLPEGSPLEGWEASRHPGSFPVARVLDVAWRAGDRDAANLPTFVAALNDPHEGLRWWAAQGCTLLGPSARPARDALRRRLDDPSPGVRVAAAEALLGLEARDPDAAEVLWTAVRRSPTDYASVQAANVLMRQRAAAEGRFAEVEALHARFGGFERQPDPAHYLGRALGRLRLELEQPSARLAYPALPP